MGLSPDLEIARHLPPPGSSLQVAMGYTRRLARTHYENFHVTTWLLPRRLRQHFCNVYAYCRWADDLGDEVLDSARALELLQWWEEELRQCYQDEASHPVFVALRETVRQFDIPMDPFLALLSAFRQDQVVRRYPDWETLMGYCRKSADPVGRLVLYLCGYRDPERQQFSDATCTALQLANFWQDVSLDLEKGRIYIPLDVLTGHGLTESDLLERRFDARYAALMKELVARTRALFLQGLPLARRVSPRLRVDIELFSRGGLAVLRAIEKIGYNTLRCRPEIGAGTRVVLLARALAGWALAPLQPARSAASAGGHA